MLVTYMRLMCNNSLEIRIAASSCRTQLLWCPFVTNQSTWRRITGKIVYYWSTSIRPCMEEHSMTLV